MSSTAVLPISRWPHRLAVALVCAVFPLIWVGGLVTTYRAGMAVEDWPTTFGYNLFLYPWHEWLFGPWKLFIEHGHRLLGAISGLITIGFAAAVWWFDRRVWLRWLALGAVGAVIVQGVLGGMRVRLDDRTLAMVHGCTGPAFFALCAALAAFTSSWWQQRAGTAAAPRTEGLPRLAWITVALAYGQLVLGAQLRHMPVAASPGTFRMVLVFHLLLAAVLLVQIGILVARTLRASAGQALLARPVIALAALLLVQVALGSATWVTNYGWPAMLGETRWSAEYVVEARGLARAHVTTAHQAVGSLILAMATLTALRWSRLAGGNRSAAAPRPMVWGAAA